MMSLEEAIEHAEDIAISAIGCECREEHRQLVEWLRELQERRKAPITTDTIIIGFLEQIAGSLAVIADVLAKEKGGDTNANA